MFLLLSADLNFIRETYFAGLSCPLLPLCISSIGIYVFFSNRLSFESTFRFTENGESSHTPSLTVSPIINILLWSDICVATDETRLIDYF